MQLSRSFVQAVTAAALLALLAGCGGATTASGTPTQTPVYVVVTDTPTGQPSAQNTQDTPAPQDQPVTIEQPFLCKGQVVEQTFERGYMFWIGGTNDERCKTTHTYETGSGEIWVAIFDRDRRVGDWMTFVDDWQQGTDIVSDPSMDPTLPGLQQPVRGFGKVWRDKLTPDQRARLGWATADEVQYTADYRYDPGGFLDKNGVFNPRPGLHTLLGLGGERLIFDEQSRLVYSPNADVSSGAFIGAQTSIPQPTATPGPTETPGPTATP